MQPPNKSLQRTRLRAPLSSVGLQLLVPGTLAILMVLSPSASQAQVSPDIRLGMYGFGPVHVGMTVAKAASASGWELVEEGESPSEGCSYVVVAGDAGVRFMVEEGVVSRVDIDDSHHQTNSGIRIGNTEEHARKVYGQSAQVSPHKYLDQGHYLTIKSRDGKYALVLETDGKRIIQIHAGRLPSAEYVEGCA